MILIGRRRAILAMMLLAPGAALAQGRAKADVSCTPRAERLQYDCVIRLSSAKDNKPLSGVNLSVGADMPSMPSAHHVAPVTATEEAEKGTYRARIRLEMHGDWMLHLDLSGPMRDRAVKMLRFEPDSVGEAPPRAAPNSHTH
jgi:hypothetical protein